MSVTLEEEDNYLSQDVHMSGSVTVLGLLNGMIGITALMLPVIGLTTGYITTIWVTLIIGFISYYTAYLIVLHLGNAKNIKESILAHFNNDYGFMRAYSFFVWLGLVPTFIGFFKVACMQILGLMGFYSQWVGPGVAALMLLIVILSRKYHYWEEVLALGIISIIVLIVFLFWALTSAPQGPRIVAQNGSPFTLASVLIQAYSIHDFLVQNLSKNKKKQDYQKLTKITFIIGTAEYTFITLCSFALVNRQATIKNATILSQYFQHGKWPVMVLQLVYIVHTISAYPTYLIVSKIRFFQIIGLEATKQTKLKDIVYLLIGVLVSQVVFQSGVNLISFFSFTGAVVGFIYVILIPISVHIKCVWIDSSSGHIQQNDEYNAHINSNICNCQNIYSSKWTLYLQTTFLIMVLFTGIALMYFTLSTLFSQ